MRFPVPILLYHSVSDHSSPKFSRWVVSPELFEIHMAYLQAAGYHPFTVTEFISGLKHGTTRLHSKPIVITFDDGFADFYTHALPVLNKFRMRATIYITTGYVGNTSSWLESAGEGNRKMMSWEQISELQSHGIECGAHGHTHQQLDILPHATAWQEIADSKKGLEDHLGRRVDSFAYPYGYYNTGLISMVQEAGFTSASAVRHALSSTEDNNYALARLIVSSYTNLEAFRLLLHGVNLPIAPYPERTVTKAWRGMRWIFSRLNIRTWS